MRFCRLTPVAGLVSLLATAPVGAEIVVLAGGGVLKVDGYRVEGERVHLVLPEGGSLVLPLGRIERVVDDEIVPPQELEEPTPAPAAARLEYREGDPVPEVPYGELIWKAAQRHGINPALVAAMARAESAFDPLAVSAKGAVGLLQLMPATADRFGVKSHRLTDPQHNLEAGLRYLAWLCKRYPDDLPRVLAAYNAGEANVDRYDGVPPFRETRSYIRRIYSWLGFDASASLAAR